MDFEKWQNLHAKEELFHQTTLYLFSAIRVGLGNNYERMKMNETKKK